MHNNDDEYNGIWQLHIIFGRMTESFREQWGPSSSFIYLHTHPHMQQNGMSFLLILYIRNKINVSITNANLSWYLFIDLFSSNM